MFSGKMRSMDEEALTPEDEIWLSHLKDRYGKWIALAGEYPHTLVGVGDDAVQAVADATRNGHPDATLFLVPPPYPLCVTPFLVALNYFPNPN